MLVSQFSLAQLEPAYGRDVARVRNVRLPYGGPYAVGGAFAKGRVLGCVGGAAASEVRTLTVGTSTGTITHTFTADRAYVVTHQNNDSLAVVKAAWEAVFGAGNVAVTGVPGTNYILTFQGQLANVRIGGLMSISSNGNAAWARTTPGSAGAGQFDWYVDAGTNNAPTTARAVLAHEYLSSPQGELVTEGRRSGQAYSPPVFVAGYFFAADLTGLDANGVADTGWRIVEGTAITEAGAVVGLGV
jgi:hypothetical protein